MSVLTVIKSKLANYKNINLTETDNSIEIYPKDDHGFTVSMHIIDNEFIVGFNGWHEHFESKTKALDCFAFGLSEECRLKVVYRGKKAVKWVVEWKQDNEWIPDSETGLLAFQFWRHRRIEYLQNHLISSDDSSKETEAN